MKELKIDPLGVIINSIVNSISIASMLLTTTSLVTNEYQNNSSKINSYTEL
jgi:chaperonin GroEL (HSP60 family)